MENGCWMTKEKSPKVRGFFCTRYFHENSITGPEITDGWTDRRSTPFEQVRYNFLTMSLVASIFGSAAASDTANSSNVPSGSLSALFGSTVTPAPKRSTVLIQEKAKTRDREASVKVNEHQDIHQNNKQDDVEAETSVVQSATKRKRKERSTPAMAYKDTGSKQRDSRSKTRETQTRREEPAEEPQPKRKKERKPKQQVPAPEPADLKKETTMSSADAEEGNDNDDTNPDREERTIFVGNLPISTTRKTLERIFRSCGKIESTRLRSLPLVPDVKLPPERAGDVRLSKKVAANTQALDTSKKNTIHGYVVFEEVESVAKALLLNNTLLPDTQIRIRVDSANPTLDPSRSVFVGNLPYHADETSLQKHFVEGCRFESPEDVEGVRIVRDPSTFACKGFGYVLFKTKALAATALSKMHESVYLKRTLRVMVCGKRYKGRRGQPKEDAGHDVQRNKSTPNKPKHQQRQQQQAQSQSQEKAKLSAAAASSTSTPIAALRRILKKEQLQKDSGSKVNKRKRGTTSSSSSTNKKKNVTAKKSGSSKRAVAEAKTDKRVKKLQKRISKGMGKAKAS